MPEPADVYVNQVHSLTFAKKGSRDIVPDLLRAIADYIEEPQDYNHRFQYIDHIVVREDGGVWLAELIGEFQADVLTTYRWGSGPG